jgi:predicted lipid-binding transport protein (Tim44 family)
MSGWLLTGASLLLCSISLVGWLFGSAIQGWTSLMLVVVVLGAVQMFVLGMIGEYLGRLYVESKRRPTLSRRGYRRAGAGHSLARLSLRRFGRSERSPQTVPARSDHPPPNVAGGGAEGAKPNAVVPRKPRAKCACHLRLRGKADFYLAWAKPA